MVVETVVGLVGNLGSIMSASASVYDIVVQKKTNERLALLEKELHNHINDTKINRELSDDEYNLLVGIVRKTIFNGTKGRIKRFAKITHDVMYSGYLDITRGEKYVYTINSLSEQEVAFLITIYKHIANEGGSGDDRFSIVVPSYRGKYQDFVEKAFYTIGISHSEWLVVLKKLDNLGIIQFASTFVAGGLGYSLSEFGKEFVCYLLEQHEGTK